jgi:type IV secretion system protein TrbL
MQENSYAQDSSGKTIIGQIVGKYEQATKQWIDPLRNAALGLFKWCAMLSVAMLGINAALNRDDIPGILKQFVLMVILIGFFLWCIQNYEEWTNGFLKGIPGLASSASPSFSIEDPVDIGINMVTKAFESFSGWDPIKGLINVVMCAIALVCLALMTGMLILVKCEAYVGVAAAIILMGLGGSTLFKDYAVNVIRYVFATGFKLLVMTLVAGIGVQFITSMGMNNLEPGDLVANVAAVVILLLLTKEVPSIVSGIISGSNVSSGLGGMGGGLAGMAGGLVGGAVGAALGAGQTAKNLGTAARVANAAGGGFGTVAKTMWDAHQAARQQPQGKFSHAESMGVHLKSRLQEMKMNPPQPKTGSGDSSGGSSGDQA